MLSQISWLYHSHFLKRAVANELILNWSSLFISSTNVPELKTIKCSSVHLVLLRTDEGNRFQDFYWNIQRERFSYWTLTCVFLVFWGKCHQFIFIFKIEKNKIFVAKQYELMSDIEQTLLVFRDQLLWRSENRLL